MKQLGLALAVLVAGSALAQEIGTEITPTTPTSGVQPQPQTQPPPPPPAEQPKQGYVYKPRGAKEERTAAPAPAWTGTKVSASGGDFGLRAGFGASGSVGIPTSTSGGASVAAPSVGIAYFAGDAFKLLVDLGFGLGLVGSNALFAVSATLGFDYLFRTPGDVLRPFFHFAGSFSLSSSGSNAAIGFGAQTGFGAEYFFNPAFSVNGRLMLAVPMSANGNFVLGIFTVTPGVGATWYL